MSTPDPSPSPAPSPLDFLAHADLPARWRGRERHVVLDLGLGAPARFDALRATWRGDAQRSERLIVLALDGPDSTDAEGGRVQWMRLDSQGDDVESALRPLQAQVDTFVLDARCALTPDLLRRLNRLAAPEARLVITQATATAAVVREALARHGFVVSADREGPPPDRPPLGGGEKTPGRLVLLPPPAGEGWGGGSARFAPRFTLPPPAAFRPPHRGPREALVIGAGLAGCAAAWALARQGWATTVLDRQPAPAQETSGNPGGLMHGTFNAPDSLHARWFRAASKLTARLARPAIASGAVAGDLRGFVRLEHRLDAAQAAEQLARVGLPDDYVRWLSADGARARTGLPVAMGGWFYAQAGWLSPGDWSRWLLAQAVSAGLARFQGDTAVAALHRDEAGGWQALDRDGRVLAEAPVVVLANANAADHLLNPLGTATGMQAVRGQTTLLAANTPGLRPPRAALSGQGYGLTLPDGRVLTGATSQPGDLDAAVRLSDHRRNLERAARLGLCRTTLAEAEGDALNVTGRVGWRATTPDRLPLIGPPIDRAACDAARQSGRRRLDGLRHLPRCHGEGHGLYLFTGLGSRGLTSAALGAQVLAAWVTGAPFPVDAALRDALDAGR
ncbi:FAD-dependent 5-carboxymethylaminomethyl-2-thiouridine(34) oxidoreductase MnmC [Sphaerotilus sp.]|uniref:FAD-dependent 5-carboxymethylaminomethyl-2-thiouridine(34) oxidoreductase MnmC n=1 Tax=Sphaerotilus sp. TaxID=2093942 RepID=UPI002ACD2246|nr:FAD-dependent 5-carboxymethylaminomethyl-2-thiouridine(34) oxidoreductase MnmC [Sphaerotilus sp.]MDZ7858728.1 FAD-dependent 5-carboxymethylaminomethyl-2-thiouridine(34) oxidoreductase MnmC [Sphaerotilus sp.]